MNKIAFGPVPSRRLGRSIGINNIFPKYCSYFCIYCQIGKTDNWQIKRQKFYDPQEIFKSLKQKIRETKRKKEKINYITFVSDGEPTLDINLGKEIELLKSLKINIAVITNSSLIWDKKVQEDLLKADCVSIKIDAIDEKIWKKINRPYKQLKLKKILSGIKDFTKKYQGILLTETMLIKNINDNNKELENIADFIKELKSNKSYISIPIRPPSEKFALPPTEFVINKAFNIFKKNNIDTELLTGYEGNAFSSTGKAEDDILSITSVHPMRQDAVNNFLLKNKKDWKLIQKLIKQKKLVETNYKGKKFYLRKIT